MNDQTYQGWTNYATWRVRLELCEFEVDELKDIIEENNDIAALIKYIKEYVEEVVSIDIPEDSLALSYALAFLDDVNYHEISNSLFDWYYENEKYTDTIEYAKSQRAY